MNDPITVTCHILTRAMNNVKIIIRLFLVPDKLYSDNGIFPSRERSKWQMWTEVAIKKRRIWEGNLSYNLTSVMYAFERHSLKVQGICPPLDMQAMPFFARSPVIRRHSRQSSVAKWNLHGSVKRRGHRSGNACPKAVYSHRPSPRRWLADSHGTAGGYLFAFRQLASH